MVSREVKLIRYYACDGCDGTEFDNCDKCLAYEREKRAWLDDEINKTRIKIITLREEVNELRLRFSVAKCDAILALNEGGKIAFHSKMVEYYEGKVNYNIRKSDLHIERRRLNRLHNMAYLWFGDWKRKSVDAKKERRDKSLRWRQENTPDKWRTPNKIRVSKLPKEDNNE